jgi:toxin ParE1/3/4
VKVLWSRRALSDLDGLDQMPERGRPGELAGTRELVLAGTPYILVYEIEASIVQILRVRHAAQDWPPREL